MPFAIPPQPQQNQRGQAEQQYGGGPSQRYSPTPQPQRNRQDPNPYGGGPLQRYSQPSGGVDPRRYAQQPQMQYPRRPQPQYGYQRRPMPPPPQARPQEYSRGEVPYGGVRVPEQAPVPPFEKQNMMAMRPPPPVMQPASGVFSQPGFAGGAMPFDMSGWSGGDMPMLEPPPMRLGRGGINSRSGY